MENNISEADLVALKQKFYDEGHTITDWADAHGFDRQAVYGVLSGKTGALIGDDHRIAVALGLKVEGPPLGPVK